MLGRIAAGRTDLVLPWLERGGDPAATHDGQSLLGWCAFYGDVSAIRHLGSRGADLSGLGPDLGLTNAAFHGHWRLCEYLVEQGADPGRAMPETGETPLHSALCKRESIAHERVVAVLLAAGADPNARTRPGVPTDNFMRDIRTCGETALHRAAAFGTARAIEMLIEAGAALDARDANGDSPLTWASWALRDNAVLRLLCFGPHRIHPERRTMAEYLLGEPHSGDDGD